MITLSIMADHCYAECHYAKCCILFIIMLNAIMLSVIMLRYVAPYSTFYSNASNTSKYSEASIQ